MLGFWVGGCGGGGSFKIYLFIFGLGVMGYWVLEEGVFGFFLLFLGQGWGVAVGFSFFLVWGGGGLRFGYIIYRCSFGFKVLGFA